MVSLGIFTLGGAFLARPNIISIYLFFRRGIALQTVDNIVNTCIWQWSDENEEQTSELQQNVIQ